jgi:hypothetical protein
MSLKDKQTPRRAAGPRRAITSGKATMELPSVAMTYRTGSWYALTRTAAHIDVWNIEWPDNVAVRLSHSGKSVGHSTDSVTVPPLGSPAQRRHHHRLARSGRTGCKPEVREPLGVSRRTCGRHRSLLRRNGKNARHDELEYFPLGLGSGCPFSGRGLHEGDIRQLARTAYQPQASGL